MICKGSLGCVPSSEFKHILCLPGPCHTSHLYDTKSHKTTELPASKISKMQQLCLLMETPIWGADAPAHGDPYMGCRGTCSWRPLHGVQMHLLMETPTWGADAPGLACLWMHGGDLCIWGVARGFMETPGYGVKMQWMHDPWVWGKDAVNAWRPLGTG